VLLSAATSSELAKYVDPTLIRIRGNMLVDYVLAVSTAPQAIHCYMAIWLGRGDQTFGWNEDNILWTGAAGSQSAYHENVSGSGDSESTSALYLPAIEVDVKAMRRMEDDGVLHLHVEGLNITSPGSFFVSWQLRMLFKE
jgi:hypothetical protein